MNLDEIHSATSESSRLLLKDMIDKFDRNFSYFNSNYDFISMVLDHTRGPVEIATTDLLHEVINSEMVRNSL